MSAIPPDEARPVLTAAQWQRLIGYGTLEDAETGTVLFQAGDVCHDLIIVELGSVEVVREPTHDREEAVVATHGAGRFVGELSLLTGQATYLSARMKDAGRVGRIKPSDFRRLMGEDPELSDLILRALLARRSALRDNEGARSLEILGSNLSAGALAIRTYVARQQLPHIWVDIDTPAGGALARAVTAVPGELPVVITPTDVLRRATPAQLADHLGLAYRPEVGETIDLAVIGAGPAGLACAVYGASEGLNTVLLDAIAVGGQAAASSRIENYLGFTSGISGEELTTRAAVQAQKFGGRATGDSTSTAGQSSRAQGSSMPPLNWRPGRVATRRWQWSAEPTPPDRPRSISPAAGVWSTSSYAVRTWPRVCPPTSRTGFSPTPPSACMRQLR